MDCVVTICNSYLDNYHYCQFSIISWYFVIDTCVNRKNQRQKKLTKLLSNKFVREVRVYELWCFFPLFPFSFYLFIPFCLLSSFRKVPLCTCTFTFLTCKQPWFSLLPQLSPLSSLVTLTHQHAQKLSLEYLLIRPTVSECAECQGEQWSSLLHQCSWCW